MLHVADVVQDEVLDAVEPAQLPTQAQIAVCRKTPNKGDTSGILIGLLKISSHAALIRAWIQFPVMALTPPNTSVRATFQDTVPRDKRHACSRKSRTSCNQAGPGLFWSVLLIQFLPTFYGSLRSCGRTSSVPTN